MKAKVLQHIRRPYMMGMLVVFALLVAAIAVPVVIAQTTTTYYGCVGARAGSLYNVGTTSPTCNKGDGTPISWNQQGPAGLKGDTGASGDAGPAGADGTNGIDGKDGVDGAIGPAGPAGATNVRTVSVQSGTVAPGSSSSQVVARCEPNEKATGGGFSTNGLADVAVFQNQPINAFGPFAGQGPGWAAGFKNNDTTGKTITVYVICASP